MDKLSAYKSFIKNCTKSPNSVGNYTDFNKINKWLLSVDPTLEKGILSIDSTEKATDILGKLESLTSLPGEKEGVIFSRAGNGQYISAFKTYIMFLNSIKLVSEYINENEVRVESPKNNNNLPLQQIFYGAPGTGKSHTIEKETKGKEVIRVTFHPDSDYSTFVGAYKPTTVEVPLRDVTGKVIRENGEDVKESRVVYNFVPQAFLKAYVKAWQDLTKPVYLVIEEINRGNCAQIFGDIFQLLDRSENGYSSYEIDPDKDIQSFLAKEFAKAVDATASDKIKSGEKMMLPSNLYIWATMNTSDQSLFPIDSAFKRRWDWKYMPIDTEKENWKLEVNGKPYSWSSFLNKINEEIYKTTSSEDKMLGFYFCKAEDKKITADRFVSKVLFYIYNDVFKDYGLDSREFFKDKEDANNVITFQSLYDSKTQKIDEKRVEKLLTNLTVVVLQNSSQQLEANKVEMADD